jgi:hypothetical protein
VNAMTKQIKAILIDPYLKTIMATNIDNSLKGLQSAIGDHYIELVRIDDRNDMYVDEEGLFRENQEFFLIKGTERVIPIAGYGIIVGSNPDNGKQINTSLNVTDIAKMIEFKTLNEIRCDIQMGAQY